MVDNLVDYHHYDGCNFLNKEQICLITKYIKTKALKDGSSTGHFH